MTTLYRMFDASSPPGSAYPGSAAVLGYLGPVGNTPHVWTVDEWLRFERLRQFPAWVGAGRTDGTGDARLAAAQMRSLGWTPSLPRPDRRAVILDMESEVNYGYVDDFGLEMWDSGYETIVYESLSAVAGNPPKEGILLADWDGIPEIPAVANVIGIQYKPNIPYDGTQIDLSAITEEMLIHGGVGPRH